MPGEIEKPAAAADAPAAAAATEGGKPSAADEIKAIGEAEAEIPLEDMRLVDDPPAAPARGDDGKFAKASDENPADEVPAEGDKPAPAEPAKPAIDLDAIRERRKAEKAAALAANLEREKIEREAIERDRKARGDAKPDGVSLEALRAKAKSDTKAALADLGIDIDSFVDEQIDARLAAAEGGTPIGAAAPVTDPKVLEKLRKLDEIEAKLAADEKAKADEKARVAAAEREAISRAGVEKAGAVLRSHGDRYETVVALDKVGAVFEEFIDYVTENSLTFKDEAEAETYFLAIADRCEVALDKENERRAATKKFQARFATREPGKSTGTPAKATGAGKAATKPSGVSAKAAAGRPINTGEDDLPLDIGKRAEALADFSLSTE